MPLSHVYNSYECNIPVSVADFDKVLIKKCLQGNVLLWNTVYPTTKSNSTAKVIHNYQRLGKIKLLLTQLWINCHLFPINSGKDIRLQVHGNTIIEIK